MRAGRSSGSLPDVVTIELTDALWAAQLRAQQAFAEADPGAVHVTETDATHHIHVVDDPALVIDWIDDVVQQVRSGPSCADDKPRCWHG